MGQVLSGYLPPPPAGGGPPSRWGDPDALKALLEDSGLRLTATSVERLAVDFPDAPAAADFLIRTAGHVVSEQQRLTDDGRWDDLRHDLVRFVQHRADPNSATLRLTLEYLLATASKGRRQTRARCRRSIGHWDDSWAPENWLLVCQDPAVLIREVSPADDGDLARKLLLVQHSAYAVEATLIQDDRIPPLHEELKDLRRAPLLWLGAFDDRMVGAVAWEDGAEALDIDRLIVAPSEHRRGTGSALVREVLHRAGTRRTVVSTGRDNYPARTLYERLGFSWVRDDEVLPGLWVTRYVHAR